MAVYFTSDLHFGHKAIINYDSRPFFSVSEMNAELIKRWNNKVSVNDTVYILGDISWYDEKETIKIFKQLKGHKNLIKGNHDRIGGELRKCFENLWDYREIKVSLLDNTIRKCILSHYPIHFYNSHYYNAIMLYGHTHNTQEQKYVEYISKWLNENDCPVELYNVGCMYYNYEPVTLDEILEKQKENK